MQKKRAMGRTIQKLLGSFAHVNDHGGELSQLGLALRDALSFSYDDVRGVAPDPRDVPCTRLVSSEAPASKGNESCDGTAVGESAVHNAQSGSHPEVSSAQERNSMLSGSSSNQSPVTTVEFFDHGPVAIDEVPLGQPVGLVNLNTAVLNGTHGVLDHYIKESGRYAVTPLEGPMAGQCTKIKPCNLTDPCDDWLDSFFEANDIS